MVKRGEIVMFGYLYSLLHWLCLVREKRNWFSTCLDVNHKWCYSNAIQFLKDLCPEMEFTSSFTIPGKRLMSHLIRTLESPVQDFCYMEPNCVSYNELVTSGSTVITTCELNNSTHNEHPQDLKSWKNYRNKGTMVSTFLSYLCFSFILGFGDFQ